LDVLYIISRTRTKKEVIPIA